MLYVKSILVGAATLLVATVLFIVILLLVVSRKTGASEVGVDVVSLIRSSPLFWLVVLIGFGVGFYWQFRRGLF